MRVKVYLGRHFSTVHLAQATKSEPPKAEVSGVFCSNCLIGRVSSKLNIDFPAHPRLPGLSAGGRPDSASLAGEPAGRHCRGPAGPSPFLSPPSAVSLSLCPLPPSPTWQIKIPRHLIATNARVTALVGPSQRTEKTICPADH